jgi:5-methylcytosine-specific restriction endonuclease McrA
MDSDGESLRGVEIAGLTFITKTQAEEHIRGILSRYGQMEPLYGDDLKFVVDLLESHPNRDIIVDCGVREIKVQHLQDKYKSRRFVLVRTDSSIRDFTWRHALYPRSARARVMRACRWAASPQVVQFKEDAFSDRDELTCGVSGKSITKQSSDVDHIPPRTFEAIVMAWLYTMRMQPEDVALVPQAGYQQPDRWEDKFLEENWKSYHRLHARLRVIDRHANLSDVKKAANGHGNA